METTWTGKVFIFDNEGGDHLASLAFPAHAHSKTMAFHVRGPFRPVLSDGGDKVANFAQWIAELNRVGFVFVLDSGHGNGVKGTAGPQN
jgi:hypothetical protein